MCSRGAYRHARRRVKLENGRGWRRRRVEGGRKARDWARPRRHDGVARRPPCDERATGGTRVADIPRESARHFRRKLPDCAASRLASLALEAHRIVRLSAQ